MENKEYNRQDQGYQGQQDQPHGVRERAIHAYDEAREGVASAGRRASDGIDEAPLIALAGGFAVGALLATLLPKTQAERDLLGPVSSDLRDKARNAAQAAKDAGRDRLRELGLTPDAGKDMIRKVVDGVSDAAKTSGKAAAGSVRSTSSSQ